MSASARSSLWPVLVLALCAAWPARAQTSWDPNAISYDGAPAWQQAAVAALNRHLPTDSGFWVLGSVDRTVDRPDTMRLLSTTLRILAPDAAAGRRITRRLWVPTGGVALEELQPADTLPVSPPPGYTGRFLKGTVVGQRTYVQVFTVQGHRWLLWAQRALLADDDGDVGRRGPLPRYSMAVAAYLEAVAAGRAVATPPQATAYGLDSIFDLYADPPAPVLRDRSGYRDLLSRNRSFSLEGVARDLHGFIPGPALSDRLMEDAESVLFPSKEGEVALQRRYRDFVEAGGRWSGHPVLTARSIRRLRPGRYVYVVDRFGTIRVSRIVPGMSRTAPRFPAAALIAHNEPVRAAGELTLEQGRSGGLIVGEFDVGSETYFFSNRSLTLFEDVERRSDRYLRAAAGHVLRALDAARVPHPDVLIRKF